MNVLLLRHTSLRVSLQANRDSVEPILSSSQLHLVCLVDDPPVQHLPKHHAPRVHGLTESCAERTDLESAWRVMSATAFARCALMSPARSAVTSSSPWTAMPRNAPPRAASAPHPPPECPIRPRTGVPSSTVYP